MRLHDDMDFTTLSWVKQELDETLKQARHALEAYVEDPEDTSQMRFCATYLHQVQGTLRMVELHGAALAVDEMEQLALALLDGGVADTDDAYTILMRGIVQLPDYLERLQSGHRDIPVVLLPLLNDLRASRGAAPLQETALFSPDLSVPLPETARGPSEPLPDHSIRVAAAKVRKAFEGALLHWFNDAGNEQVVTYLQNLCDRLCQITSEVDLRRSWWIAAGVLEGIAAGALKPSRPLQVLFGKLDREIKEMALHGEQYFGAHPPDEVCKAMLYYVAHAEGSSPRIDELKAVFGLDLLLPRAEELEHAKGAMAGHNRELLTTVSGAIKEDLLRVKDALDLKVRQNDRSTDGFAEQCGTLERVADTLGMLGMGVPRKVVLDQKEHLERLIEADSEPSESSLLDIAGSLLYVESSLDDYIDLLGADEGPAATAAPSAEGVPELPKSEVRRILDALMKEASSNLQVIKQSIVEFIEAPWDHERVRQTPELLQEIIGALRMLDLDEAAMLLDGVIAYAEVELLHKRSVPDAEELDTFADALASLEYYLEAVREHRQGRDKILDVARQSLNKLGYLGDAAEQARKTAHSEAAEKRAEESSEADAAPDMAKTMELKAVEAVPAEDATGAVEAPATVRADGAADMADDIDEEIREVFIEEVEEELANLQELLPKWKTDLEDEATLTTIRRTFHTLKGSGRLVGALTIGEFSWEIENVLNRLLDGSITASPAVVDLMDHALAALPQLLANVKGEGRPSIDIEAIKGVAARLAAREEAWLQTPAAEVGTATPQAAAEDRPEPDAGELAEVAEGEGEESAAEDFQVSGEEEPREPAIEVDAVDLDELAAEQDQEAADLELPDLDELPVETADSEAFGEAQEDEQALEFDTFELPAFEVESPDAEDLETPDFEGELLHETDSEAAAQASSEEPLFGGLEEPEDLEALEFEETAAEHEASTQEQEDEQSTELTALDADDFAAEADSLEFEIPAAEEEASTTPEEESLLEQTANEDDWLDFTEDSASPEIAEKTPQSDSVDDVIAAAAIELESDQLAEALDAEGEDPQSRYDLESFLDELSVEQDPAGSPVAEDGPDLEELERELIAEETSGEASGSIDPVLQDILRTEVTGHLAVISDFLSQAAAGRPAVASEPLLRAVHTLNGAIAMVGLPALGAVTGPLEGYVKRLRLGELAPSETGVRALEDSVQTVQQVIADLDNPQAEPVDTTELGLRLSGLRDDLPEPESLRSLFPVVEAEEAEDVDTAGDDEGAIEVAGEADLEEDEAQPELSAEHGEELAEIDLSADIEPFDALEEDAEVEDAGSPESLLEEPATVAEDAEDVSLDDAIAEDLGEKEVEGALDADVAAAQERMDQSDVGGEEQPADLSAEEPAAEVAESPVEQEQEQAVEPIADEPLADEATVGAEDLEELQEQAEIDEESREQAVEPADSAEEQEQEADEEPADEAPQVSDQDKAVEGVAELASDMEAWEQSAAEFAELVVPDEETVSLADLGELDDDLLEIFLQEGAEILDASDHKMAEWREAPQNQEAVTQLQRELHTLKGGARMTGLLPIGDLSHAMESLFEGVVEDRVEVTTRTIEILEYGFDRLHQMLDKVHSRQPMSTGRGAIMQIEALLTGNIPAPPELSEDRELAEEAQVPEAVEVELPSPEPLPELRPTALDEQEAQAGAPARPQQELIRVRADLLDNLVNYAGEVSIYRSRLEQQIGTFRFNLVEFDQTVKRLRDQLRKLEMETEAQILSRYQREAQEMEETFDPLELDRFSTLQQLSRALAESVSDLVSIQGMLDDLTRQSETLLLQQSRVNSDLQEGLMRTRMVPFDSLVPRLRRILRQTSQELGKKASLRVDGAQGEMDRTVLERITAPLEHMLRNAIAHGLETPEARERAGKPAEGVIRLAVSREATEVVIAVADDGAGIDDVKVRKKALERGLLKKDAELTDRDLYGLILQTGFSTVDEVTKLAGRGVGMDVVNSEIKQLGGSLDITSDRGAGTTFVIRLPFTLAVTHAIMVRVGDSTFAVPLSSIQGVVRMSRREFERRLDSGETTYEFTGEEYQLQELAVLLGLERREYGDDEMVPVLMSRIGDQRAAIRVDLVMGSREVVVKSVGPQISSVPGIFGATILGDGSVIMILDLGPLIRRGAALRLTAVEPVAGAVDAVVEAEVPEARLPLIMVVDDSITMRKVTTRVLQRHEMEVVTAKDGVDALEQLQDRLPDLMLLDIEMPRMDGYELATHMRNDERLKGVPIIMVTSRSGEKHRERALEIGVNRYMGKPYQEADLLTNVRELLEETVAT